MKPKEDDRRTRNRSKEEKKIYCAHLKTSVTIHSIPPKHSFFISSIFLPSKRKKRSPSFCFPLLCFFFSPPVSLHSTCSELQLFSTSLCSFFSYSFSSRRRAVNERAHRSFEGSERIEIKNASRSAQTKSSIVSIKNNNGAFVCPLASIPPNRN